MGADMLIQSIGLKAKGRFGVDEEWAKAAFAKARQAIESIDEAKLTAVRENIGTSCEDGGTCRQALHRDLAEVEAAVLGNHRQAATVEGGSGIIVLLSGGLSWGDPPTELFDSMSRLLEADVFPDARWPEP